MTLKVLCIGGEIHSDMDKIWRANVSILCMLLHETIRNRLIGYLTFISVNWNLETTNWLTGYLVKVHSIKIPMQCIMMVVITMHCTQ